MSPVVKTNGHGHGGDTLRLSSLPIKTRLAAPVSPAMASKVVFQTAEGVAVDGTPVQFNRHSVVWELYNSSLAPRLSEALDQFKIIYQGRTVYAGRAVVNNLVDAGTKTVCEAALEEVNWQSVDFTERPAEGQVAEEFKTFICEWQKLYQVSSAFKVVVADMQTFLTDLRLWLEQVELGIRAAPARQRSHLERKIAAELEPLILPLITSFFEKFETCLHVVAPESLPAHQVFARRQLHPLLLCSPFLYRCFTKPLGYAGDYEMVNMMLREPLEGGSLYAKIINLWFLRQPPAEAHRNRIRRLVRQLRDTTDRAARQGRTARILNVGCGPVHEVQQFLQASHLADRAEFTLIDFNEETLAHCRLVMAETKEKFNRRTQFKFVKKSVQQIVRESLRRDESATNEKYDLVYCAGLFDYLSDAFCRQLTEVFYDWLAPGGKLLTTNVDAYNPRRLSMVPIMEWHLFYRNSHDLMALKPASAPVDACAVKADPTGVNIYFEAQKPERE